MSDDTTEDICGHDTEGSGNGNGPPCQNPPTEQGGDPERCWIPSHNGKDSTENPPHLQPTVEEHLDDIRPHLEKPISDKAAIAQSPISRKTHKEWLNKDGEPFASYQEMYHDARAVAEERLVERGLVGDYDSSLVKFLLKATMDYEDKQTREVTGAGGGPVKVLEVTDEWPDE